MRTLGPLQLLADGQAVRHPDWDTRTRVRELFGLLASRGRVARSRVIALCWPDLDQARALRNLRVTLTYLNRALDAAGLSSAGRRSVVATGESLALDLTFTSDADEFDAILRRAIDHDRAGAPAAALALYRQALDLYEGDYLADLSADWVMPDRTRLQLLATDAMLRAGELVPRQHRSARHSSPGAARSG